MKRITKATGLLLISLFVSTACATPKAWLSTSYRSDSGSYQWYRSPVTGGYMDVLVLVEQASFNGVEFAIRYDSSIVHPIGSGSVHAIRDGLALSGVTTANLEGTWRQATLSFTGAVTLGEVQYDSDALFRVRLTPKAEGTVPLSLWVNRNYPPSYQTCSLSLSLDGAPVPFERKEGNDQTSLVTFTDKTGATVCYHYDLNLGIPIPGYLVVEYNDGAVVEFRVSDPGKGITIDTVMGGYFVTAQPDARSHTLIFPGYESWTLDEFGGWTVSHTQPTTLLFFREKYSGIAFGTIPASAEDAIFTFEHPEIGKDFSAQAFGVAIFGDAAGVLAGKQTDYERVSDDVLRLIVRGGLAADYYSLYLYRDGEIVGRTWFLADIYHPVTFTVTDELDQPLAGARVGFLVSEMFKQFVVDQMTDGAGQTRFDMPGGGQGWPSSYDYFVQMAGYGSTVGTVEVNGAAVAVPVALTGAQAVTIEHFAPLSAWWMQKCAPWNNYCDRADVNFDGKADLKDMVELLGLWLKESAVAIR